MKVQNVLGHYRKLRKGSSLEKYEPVTLVTPPDVQQPHIQDTTSKLQDVIPVDRQ
jgi:hypothetical protein